MLAAREIPGVEEMLVRRDQREPPVREPRSSRRLQVVDGVVARIVLGVSPESRGRGVEEPVVHRVSPEEGRAQCPASFGGVMIFGHVVLSDLTADYAS